MKGFAENGFLIPEIPVSIVNANWLCSGEQAGNQPDDLRTVEVPDCRQVIPDANLRRRMGHLLKMSVYCGLRSIEDIVPEDVAGIITATGIGFMKDTVTFGDSIFDRNEELLNPSPFMQSTFNTASGYIALARKIRAYNTTYVHRAGGIAAALADAVMLLEETPDKYVLAGGFDEAVAAVDRIRRRLGYCSGEHTLPLGEGAGFFCLTGREPEASAEKSRCRLLGVAPASASREEFIGACASMSPECLSETGSVKMLRCSEMAETSGVFPTMFMILLCRASVSAGTVLVVDDVNPDGLMALTCSDIDMK